MIDLQQIQTASNDVVRNINRRIVLNLLRTRQPISRADLARASGMQRSTISLIVEELVTENWIVEGPTGRPRADAAPTFLRLNEERTIIGVDIRPTNTTIALSDINGKFGSQEILATPRNSSDAIAEVVRCIQRIKHGMGEAKAMQLEGIGISLPGRIDPSSDRLVFAPNLGWRDVDIRGPISSATNLSVEVENAANACALAAIWFDGMECYRNMVVLTVSEGIGAGILMDGRLAGGMAGEFGHVPLDPQDRSAAVEIAGAGEVFASNRAALRYYGEPEASFQDVLNRADEGDARAVAALEMMARYLGHGMRAIVAGLAPERILVVGDLTRSWSRFGPVIEAEMRGQVLPGSAPPELIPVHEGGLARLRGTVALVLQKHFGEVQPWRGLHVTAAV